MGAQSRGHLYHVPSHKLQNRRTTLTASIWHIERGSCTQLEKLLKQFFQITTVKMTILIVDQMLNIVLIVKMTQLMKKNDMEDNSFVLPPSNFSQDVETVSNDQEGNCFTTRIM